MIDRILTPFDVLLQMPIETQCWHAIGVSFVGFVIAAIIRETAKAPCLRYTARALGAGSYFFVAAFAVYATHEVVKLNQIVSQKHATPVSEVPVYVLHEAKTQAGNTISWGGFRSVSTGDGRAGRSWNSTGRSDAFVPTAIHGTDILHHAELNASNSARSIAATSGADSDASDADDERAGNSL